MTKLVRVSSETTNWDGSYKTIWRTRGEPAWARGSRVQPRYDERSEDWCRAGEQLFSTGGMTVSTYLLK